MENSVERRPDDDVGRWVGVDVDDVVADLKGRELGCQQVNVRKMVAACRQP